MIPTKMIKGNKRNKTKNIILCAVVALFLISVLSGVFARKVFLEAGLRVAQPVLILKNKTLNWLHYYGVIFDDKTKLQKENDLLKQQILKMETDKAFSGFLEEENNRLEEALQLVLKDRFLLAGVISRPGYGDYNSLIIDRGSSSGVREGAAVTFLGKVLLGHVIETASSVSKVKLVSHPENEINVFAGNVAATAIGRGGENMEIELPKSVDIGVGDYVTTVGTSPLFLGVVEEIIEDPINPFKKIVFRLPLNIQELRYVYIVR